MRRNQNLIVGLDIGTSKAQALAVCVNPENSKLEVISKVVKPCFGVRKGVVVDVERVSEICSSVLKRVEQESGQNIHEVFLSLNGSHVFSTISQGTVAVSRADQVVSAEDINRVKDAAKTFSLPPNREILRVFPQEYSVDKESGIREPVGMKGVRLQVKILVVAYFAPYFNNLRAAVTGAGYDIGYIMAKPIASAQAVLTPREKELGVLMIDIGAGTTSFCVFKEGALLKLGIVPVGSFNITKDLGVGFRTDIDTAEEIKLRFAACGLNGKKKLSIEEQSSGEEIELIESKIGKIVDARVIEIFELIQKDLKELGSIELPGGVVLTGGGAKLPGIEKMSREELGLVTRIGAPIGLFPSQADTSLSTVCGLVLKGKEFFEEENGSIVGKITGRVRSFLKDFIP